MSIRILTLNAATFLVILSSSMLPASGGSMLVEPAESGGIFESTGRRGVFRAAAATWADLDCASRRTELARLARELPRSAKLNAIHVLVDGRRVASHDGRIAIFYPDLQRGEHHDVEMLRRTNDPVAMDQPPALLSMPTPDYPSAAREQGIHGVLQLRALVGVEGQIEEIILPQGAGLPGLNDVAIAAARQAVFQPALRADQPVAIWTLVPFEFVLD